VENNIRQNEKRNELFHAAQMFRPKKQRPDIDGINRIEISLMKFQFQAKSIFI